jgi:hypothetical protein
MAASELQPPSAQLAAQTANDTFMLARAIVAVLDGEDDPEAIRFARIKAALGTPNDALDRFQEEREMQAIRPKVPGPPPFDAHADTKHIREAKYATLPPWSPES